MAAARDTLSVASRREWRAWLARHHASSPGVWLVFHSSGLADGSRTYRRDVVMWIHTAKQPDTRERRMRESVGLLATGKKLGLT